MADMLREKYGLEPAEMWERVESEAGKAGVKLDLSQQPRMFLQKRRIHHPTRQTARDLARAGQCHRQCLLSGTSSDQ